MLHRLSHEKIFQCSVKPFHTARMKHHKPIIYDFIFETNKRLFVTTFDKFDLEAPAISARDASFKLDTAKLTPDNLFIGEKALIYAYAESFNAFNNFW